jgi:hypothetical protein
MTTGFSTRLAKGQLGIVDKGAAPSSLGMAVTSTITTPSVDRNRLFELRLGITPLTPTRSQSDKAYSTVPFKISEIVSIKANAPKVGVSVDELLIGYDGINANSAIVLSNGDNEVIDITLSGEAIGMLGYPEAKVTVKLYLEAPDTGAFTMHQIIEDGVKRLKDMTLLGEVPISNYIDITPVNSDNISLTTLQLNDVPSTFYRLTVRDNGNAAALGLVQAQYPLLNVKRESYVVGTSSAGTSVYVALGGSAVPAAFSVAVATLADTNCDGIPEINTNTSTIAWVTGSTCAATQKTYTLQLKDTDCGSNRLAEVKAAYPMLNVVVDTANASWAQSVTATVGASGVFGLNIAGVDYNQAYATSMAATVTAWFTTHGSAITSATGAVVTNPSAGVITLTDLAEGFPAIVLGATNTFTATVGAVTGTGLATTGACQTVYRTVVTSNVVCEECSPMLRDLFITDAPYPFAGINWVAAPTTYSATAKMGIRLKGKVNILAGSEEYRDDMPFVYSSTRLSVANEAPGTVNESYKSGTNGRFKVKMLSIAADPESLGAHYYDLEERTRVYFENRQRLAGNNYGKAVLGQGSHLKPTAQYVDYVVRVRTTRFAQSFSGEVVENFDYHILAEIGKHAAIQTQVNLLATAAGLPTVSAGY